MGLTEPSGSLSTLCWLINWRHLAPPDCSDPAPLTNTSEDSVSELLRSGPAERRLDCSVFCLPEPTLTVGGDLLRRHDHAHRVPARYDDR